MATKAAILLGLPVVVALLGVFILLQDNRQKVARPYSNRGDTAGAGRVSETALPMRAEDKATPHQGYPIPIHVPSVPTQADSQEGDDPQSPSYVAMEQRMNRLLAEKRRNLTLQERNSIYVYLSRVNRAEPEKSVRNVIRNDLMELLCWQSPPPGELANKLIEIYRDRRIAVVTRDYAVQHLAFFCEKTVSQEDRESILQALWQAVDTETGSISGTALLGIYHIHKSGRRVDDGRLRAAALRLATMSEAVLQARVTAIRLCGRLGEEGIRPFLEEIVRSESNVVLLTVAKAAIGDLEAKKLSRP